MAVVTTLYNMDTAVSKKKKWMTWILENFMFRGCLMQTRPGKIYKWICQNGDFNNKSHYYYFFKHFLILDNIFFFLKIGGFCGFMRISNLMNNYETDLSIIGRWFSGVEKV